MRKVGANNIGMTCREDFKSRAQLREAEEQTEGP